MPQLLRQSSWVWPLAFAAILAIVDWHALSTLRVTMEEQVRSSLQTTLHATEKALDVWIEQNAAITRAEAADDQVQKLVLALLESSRTAKDPREALRSAPEQAKLAKIMNTVMSLHGFRGWGVMDPSGLMLANGRPESIGLRPDSSRVILANGIERDRPIFTPPIIWTDPDDSFNGTATMIVGAAIVDPEDRPVAALGFSFDPAQQFAGILEVGRLGRTGETYAFSEDGKLLSPSRHEAELRAIGLLPDDPSVSSALNIEIRNPGGDLAEGFETDVPLKARPLTVMAASAVAGQPGADVEGYRDYRGTMVAGAWTWFPELGVGLATELDAEEAYSALHLVRQSLLAMIGVMVVGALGMLAYSIVVMRQQSEIDEAQQLGRYRIEGKLGSGGMGTVYLARHALLRRKTAIKVLKNEDAGEEGIKRFEREVQVSSSLTHPNTIEIYDYGTTPDGTFYYAMELLHGITLSELVEDEGALPEARATHLMRQAASSLAEAHASGLIHRDLKPTNVMVCERGGLLDFVKVLDFGLVRSEEQTPDTALTLTTSFAGTPLYMAPESLEAPEKVSIRSDVYQLGAITYYLLTGKHVFSGESLVEVLSKHLNKEPQPIADLRGEPVAAGLDALVMSCLAKDPSDRPRDAGEFVARLDACEIAGIWSQYEASAWWEAYSERNPGALDPYPREDDSLGSAPSGYQVDMRGRLEKSTGKG